LFQGLPHKKLALCTLAIVLVAGVTSLTTMSFSQSAERWDDFKGSMKGRVETYQTCLTMIKAAGIFGLGPGTFSTAFPYFVKAEGRESDFFFHTAHEDYLQGLIEWGWLGFIVWMALLFISITIGIKAIGKGSFYAAAILIAILSAAFQAIVDFPGQIGSLQWLGIFLFGILVSPSRTIGNQA
jgi:O-antigen ligase